MSVIMHPRPSPIAAAMYTLRDLDVDVIVLHGPSGCCFRPARLLERDGVKVVTSALLEDDFVFGSEGKLSRVLKRVDELFKPRLIGLVGSCASMIIGEDLKKAAREAGLLDKTICCDVHSGSGDNTVGAIVVLREAMSMGLIPREEFERQKRMLEMATQLEQARGTARGEYIDTCVGDSPKEVARAILGVLASGGKVACVLNAKKETAFLYADVTLAICEASRRLGGKVQVLANLDPSVGLPRVRLYSRQILGSFSDAGVAVDAITGGIDEYPASGEKAKQIILNSPPDLAVISGIPHAVAVERAVRTVAVSVGSRAVSNLKSLGYDYVVGERDAHQVSLGRNKQIRRSLLGQAIREGIRA
ncbi:MAG: Ni-sirohydrochlorin a,c-diamide reductive cyclase catalytic subunit [Candidatus Methanosuratincola sp.]|uniref:Nitrogenase vanadium-cofactor synthesis protein VnfN n=1 Tax=Methanosuratincola subterraneus TaxID=2593994 RepID=A0A444L983_METS7|nr:MAG: Nitrogenase vanadium-cofactor synthesis protein VnfN [Candidatus Methanosuratincola subterraneus]